MTYSQWARKHKPETTRERELAKSAFLAGLQLGKSKDVQATKKRETKWMQ